VGESERIALAAVLASFRKSCGVMKDDGGLRLADERPAGEEHTCGSDFVDMCEGASLIRQQHLRFHSIPRTKKTCKTFFPKWC
jgi:hypothetical protein